MTCFDAIDFLAAYLDGELSPETRERFESHLAICPSCVAYLETYEATIRLGKAALGSTADEAPMPEELVQAILAARGS